MSEAALGRVSVLVDAQRFGVLCTSTQGFPYASLVAIAAESDMR